MGGYFGFGVGLPPSWAIQILNNAANIAQASNPAYTWSDFVAYYPQFGTGITIPAGLQADWVAQAQATVLQSRWHSWWAEGMANYIAHQAVVYLKLTQASGSTAALLDSSAVQTVDTSQSVGSMSYSSDLAASGIPQDGWEYWRTTPYGVMFSNKAKLIGRGGSYVC